jgi:putative transcriptional regulator
VGSFSIVPIGTYAASTNFHHLRDTTNADADCLCLAVTDAPLKLTSPLGRLLNPFVRI